MYRGDQVTFSNAMDGLSDREMKTRKWIFTTTLPKGSFDGYLWATQENKLRYIKQIMTSKEPIRAAEDIDEQNHDSF